MTVTSLRTAALVTLTLLAPALAQAHPGHAHDATFAAGALHPLTGADHVLLLVFAGWLASRLHTPTLRVLGAAFFGVLAATASAHGGTDAGAAAFTAGLLLASAGLVAASAAATRLARRHLTAASRR